jgi:hypothetical protein
MPGGRSRPESRIPRSDWRALRTAKVARAFAGAARLHHAQRWFQGKGRALRDVSVTDLLPAGADGSEHRIAAGRGAVRRGSTPRRTCCRSRMLEAPTAQQLLDEHPAARSSRSGWRRRHRRHRRRHVRAELPRRAARHGARAPPDPKGPRTANCRARPPAAAPCPSGRMEDAEPAAGRGAEQHVHRLRPRHRRQAVPPAGGGRQPGPRGRQFLGEHGFATRPRCSARSTTPQRGPARTLAVVQEFVPNEGDAWALTLDAVGEFFERAAAEPAAARATPTARHTRRCCAWPRRCQSDAARALVGPYLEEARLLGERTAEMHLVLASRPMTRTSRPRSSRSSTSARSTSPCATCPGRVLQQLAAPDGMPGSGCRARSAAEVLACEQAILQRFRASSRQGDGYRIRCHGDFHLGQVLYTGNDFYHHGLRGRTDPAAERAAAEAVAAARRGGHAPLVPLRRVRALIEQEERSATCPTRRGHGVVGSLLVCVRQRCAFLNGYLTVMASPTSCRRTRRSWPSCWTRTCWRRPIYELGYELGNRPDWAAIPLRGVLHCSTARSPTRDGRPGPGSDAGPAVRRRNVVRRHGRPAVRSGRPEALSLTLRALGARWAAALRPRRAARTARRTRRLVIQPVHVAWDGALPELRVGSTTARHERVRTSMRLESGESSVTQQCRRGARHATARAAGRHAHHPSRPPRALGYHRYASMWRRGATLRRSSSPRRTSRVRRLPMPGVGPVLAAVCAAGRRRLGRRRLHRPPTGRRVGGRTGRRLRVDTAAARDVPRCARSSRARIRRRAVSSGTNCSSMWTAVPGGRASARRFGGRTPRLRQGASSTTRVAALHRARPRTRPRARRRWTCDASSAQFADASAHRRTTPASAPCATGAGRLADLAAAPARRHIRDGDYAPEDFEYHLFAQWQADRQLGASEAASQNGARCALPGHAAGREPDSYDAGGSASCSPPACRPVRRRIRCSRAARTGGSAAEPRRCAPAGTAT